MVLVQNKKVRTVTLEKVAFFYILSQPIPHPQKIYQRLSNYIDRNSEYIDDSTQHIDLPTNFAKKQRQNHQPIPHQHPRPYKRKKHQVPPVLFPHSKTNDKPPHAPSQSRPSSVLPARIFQ